MANQLKIRTPKLNLLLWSLMGIFSQLAFVRMFTTFAGGTAYYGNMFLLVGIISLAGGFFAPRLSRHLVLLPYFILIAFLSTLWISTFNLIPHISGEFLWSTIANVYPRPADFDLQLAIIILSLTIIPVLVLIGSQQAYYLLSFSQGFVGYLVMALGGVIGAVLFSLQNQFLPAFTWLVFFWVGILLLLLIQAKNSLFQKLIYISPLIFFLVLGVLVSSYHYWSPYQRIDLVNAKDNNQIHILANGFFLSSVSTEHIAESPRKNRILQSKVFKCIGPEDEVLVLGSCGGTNDVREALYAGAKKVTAVEIDPCFVQIGNTIDPDKSYRNSRVKTVIGDARRFLLTDDGKYDTIYMAFLDSQTNASNKARFRLDSFLYTSEGIDLVLSHLKADGLLYINFATGTFWIRNRIFQLLENSSKNIVRVFQRQSGIQTLYVVSKQNLDLDYLKDIYNETTSRFKASKRSLIPTDDWPFLYCQHKRIPQEHFRLLVIMFILMAAILSICQNIEGADKAVSSQTKAAPMLLAYAFFSGAAFFFIELRTISALTPILGSSYLSQAMVIIAVIISSFLGNLSASFKLKPNITAVWLLLFVSLALVFQATGLFHPLKGNILPSVGLYVIVFILPTFIAGHLYLHYLLGHSAGTVLNMQKWNFFGGALGGLGEVTAIYFGFQRSLWIIVTLYLLSLISITIFIRNRKKTTRPIPL